MKPVTRFLVLAVAAIGFLFDTYELLMLPLIGGPALSELLGVPPSNPMVRGWLSGILWAAAVCGGIAGLFGGWMIDRFGRKTVMIGSILVYSFSPLAAAFSTNVWMFAFFRCTTFIGVCVEFVAAITWLAELFQDKKAKELAIGWTQAFASVGGLVVTGANFLMRQYAEQLPAIPVPLPLDPHAYWRYTLCTGLVPGALILLLMPFVPESQVWLERKRAGTLRRPSFAAIFAPEHRRTTIVATILSACAYASAFGALQLTPTQIAPGSPKLEEQQAVLKPLQDEALQLNGTLNERKATMEGFFATVPGLKAMVDERDAVRRDIRKLRDTEFEKTEKGEDASEISAKIKELTGTILPPSESTKRLTELTKETPDAKTAVVEYEKALKDLGDNRNKLRKAAKEDKEVKDYGESTQFFQETGGLVGRILLAILLVLIVNRGWLLRLFQIPGLIFFPLTYLFLFKQQPDFFSYGVFVCGLCTVAQFSYFGEYLPKVYPVHLRGIGGSFATNVGGRMIGTSASVLTTSIAVYFAGDNAYQKVAVAAAVVAGSVYAISLVASFFLPQPQAQADE